MSSPHRKDLAGKDINQLDVVIAGTRKNVGVNIHGDVTQIQIAGEALGIDGAKSGTNHRDSHIRIAGDQERRGGSSIQRQSICNFFSAGAVQDNSLNAGSKIQLTLYVVQVDIHAGGGNGSQRHIGGSHVGQGNRSQIFGGKGNSSVHAVQREALYLVTAARLTPVAPEMVMPSRSAQLFTLSFTEA